MRLIRTCRCYPLQPQRCRGCRDFLARRKALIEQIAKQLKPGPAPEPSLSELKAANQARIRRERYGDDAA